MPKYLDASGLEHFWETIKETVGHVTPQLFGAKADGITDDLTAFTSMLSYAATNGVKAVVPVGTYLLSDCVFSDDAVVLQDGGTYTDGRLVVSKDIKADVMPTLEKVLVITDTEIVSNSRVLQGVCYDSKNDRVVMAFVYGDSDPAYLVAYDTSLTTKLASNTVQATSHFNDLTYNPKTNLIYTPARPTVDTIYTINADTLAVTGSFTIDFGGIVKRFSYDPDNDIYFASGDDYIKVYDSSFNQIDSFVLNFDIEDLAEQTGVAQSDVVIRQSSIVQDGQFLMLWNEIGGESANFKNVWLTQFDYATQKMKRSYVFNSSTGFDEAEAMYNIGSKLYVISAYGRKQYISSLYLGNVDYSRDEPPSDTYIAANTDMNDLIRYGEYVCPATDIAATLTNCPFAVAFRLYVLKATGGNNLVQVFVNHTGTVYVRYYRHDTGAWADRGFVQFMSSYGTSNGWHYRMNADGTMTAWISKSLGSIAASEWTASGQLYYVGKSVELPAFSGTISSYNAQITANQQCYASVSSISGTTLSFILFGPITNARSVTVRISLDLAFQ